MAGKPPSLSVRPILFSYVVQKVTRLFGKEFPNILKMKKEASSCGIFLPYKLPVSIICSPKK